MINRHPFRQQWQSAVLWFSSMGSECSESKRFIHVFPWFRRCLYLSLVVWPCPYWVAKCAAWSILFPSCVYVCFPQNTQEKCFFFSLLLKSIEYGSDLDNSLPVERLQAPELVWKFHSLGGCSQGTWDTILDTMLGCKPIFLIITTTATPTGTVSFLFLNLTNGLLYKVNKRKH